MSTPDTGVAAVEFAIVAPLLLLLVFGAIQFGTLFAQQLALSNGARQGARFGAVPDSVNMVPTSTCAAIAQQVQSAASTIGMSGSDVAVSITGPNGPCSPGDASTIPCQHSSPGSDVEVTASYTGSPLVPFPYPGSFTLSASGRYECEFS